MDGTLKFLSMVSNVIVCSPSDIGLFLRCCLILSNLSQKDFCSKVCLDPSAFNRIVSGKSNPTISTLFEIFGALGVSVELHFDDSFLVVPPIELPTQTFL